MRQPVLEEKECGWPAASRPFQKNCLLRALRMLGRSLQASPANASTSFSAARGGRER
jgi:hypothetical protein